LLYHYSGDSLFFFNYRYDVPNGGQKGEGIADYIAGEEAGRGNLANGGGGAIIKILAAAAAAIMEQGV